MNYPYKFNVNNVAEPLGQPLYSVLCAAKGTAGIN